MASNSTISNDDLKVYYIFSAIIMCSILLGMLTEKWIIIALPALILGIVLIIKEIRFLYYGFFALLPFSVEIQLGSVGTDLPSEPIMLGLTGIGILLFLKNIRNIPRNIIYHPITILLTLHILWIFITAIFSQTPLFSFKFFLAKLWYVFPFYFLGFYILRGDNIVRNVYRFSAVFLTAAVLIVLARHALLDFSFDTSNEVVYPIFRNHVNYAAMIVTVIPYMWALWAKDKRLWQFLSIAVLLVGTYFSYTRAAHLCIFIMIGGYFVFKYNYGRLALTFSAIGGILLGVFLINENRYLNFAPDFQKTISHDKFDNLVEATYKLEDISTMERVYRWVAGGHMIGNKPIVGYGPSGFYHNYTKFTLSMFETYVSDNPEKSGIHCYYLMTWVEQGTPGLLIFLGLCIALLLIGQRTFRSLESKESKRIIMAATLSTVSICALCLINDLIEADKVGPFFFLNASIIAIYDLKSRDKVNETK